VDICVPDRLPQSLGLCRMPGGGDKKSMGLNNNSCYVGFVGSMESQARDLFVCSPRS
jgi:hypothetical protein